MKQKLTDESRLEQTDSHIHIEFKRAHHILSSAVLNGGLQQAQHILNMRVEKHDSPNEAPETTLENYCRHAGWQGQCIGLMTAASMQSLAVEQASIQGVEIAVLVTTGLTNPRRVGDRAEYRQIATKSLKAGTINIIVITSASLTQAAMVEAVQIITEAKAAAVQQAGIVSPVSGKIATGTGTDAVAMASGSGERVHYCGKHVLFGEVLGRLVKEAVIRSIKLEENLSTRGS